MGDGSRLKPETLFKEYDFDPKDVYSCYYQFKKFHGKSGIFKPKEPTVYPSEYSLERKVEWVK